MATTMTLRHFVAPCRFPAETRPVPVATQGLGKHPAIASRLGFVFRQRWVKSIGLDPTAYGTHTMRRTKATLIYKRTKNLRAVQLLLGHTKLESTVRYLGIEVDDALEDLRADRGLTIEIEAWRPRGHCQRAATLF